VTSAVDLLPALATTRVLPVLTVEAADDAPALVTTLARAGLRTVEITLRTEAALDAIRRAVEEAPDAIVGAGSVTSAALAVAAAAAGALFLVAPGLDAETVRAADDLGLPMVPGIATATELQQAVALGRSVVKLFPAELVGGPRLIEALSAIWPDIGVVPTGGITASNADRYLALPQVVAVGGSWMAPPSAIAARDWPEITRLATTAARLAGDRP
jgi:2-dehydro-3-deoxyphosphogluconate aldolase/(4S)-4-hydroxy-2-oxoglutarate aldolase